MLVVLLASALDAGLGASVEPPPRPSLLGLSEARLRDETGAALRSQKIEQRNRSVLALEDLRLPAVVAVPSDTAARSVPALTAKDPFAEQQRLVEHRNGGDVRGVEYELFRSRVYRVRWQLAERFERPLMASLVPHLTAEFGKPYYDQLIEGKFGSGRATLRRAAWRSGSRIFEVRQLNPLVGGPIFLTLSDRVAIRAIVASGGTAAPEPDSIGPWWSDPIKPFSVLTSGERNTLLAAFDSVRVQIDWGR